MCDYSFCIRLDQYATTISSSIIGVIGTMFGLTAASYAFVWGELKSDRETNTRLKYILEKYKSELWNLFFNTLILSFFILLSNLVLLGVIQINTDPTLYYGERGSINNKDVVVNTYFNEKYASISTCILLDLVLSIFDVIFMGKLNHIIFARQRSYENIAKKILKNLSMDYNLELADKISKKYKQLGNELYDFNSECNKIHYLELLVNRILKNHESEGDAFSHSYNDVELLKHIFSLKLYQFHPDLGYISNEAKSNDLKKKCLEKKNKELNELNYSRMEIPNEENNKRKAKNKIIPVEVNFVQVYNDLIMFRNAQLVYWNKDIRGTMLKCTIKKRLLIFLMSNERFDGMDLTNVSLSGADLSYSNFSNCNLKGVRLKGTNCKGVDFSNSRMPGIHFYDNEAIDFENIQEGDIEISYQDDGENEWNIYTGRQPTCLKEATFANADVSRMTLIADGDIDSNSYFPFSGDKIPVLGNKVPFSLFAVNFDGAKLFNSKFNNIDLSNSSVFKAQMFNSVMKLVNSEKVNFSETVLTHSVIESSRFVNANFQKAAMSDCDIYRSDFSYANLSGANFSNSKITVCNFKNSICNNTSFKSIICINKKNESKFDNLLLFEYATMRNADFSNADLSMIDFSYANVLNCNFTKSVICDAKFYFTVLLSTIWNSAVIKDTEFKNTIMRDCVFINANFINCNFNNCDFSNSIINCEFNCGSMSYVRFCNVKELNPNLFNNIILSCVDFTGSGIVKDDFPKSVFLKNCIFDKISKKGRDYHRYNKRKKKYKTFR